MLKIPISVVVATRNEEKNIARCLRALNGFDEVIVVDSNSTDNTLQIVNNMGIRVERFDWDGQYPKKRQWILDNVTLLHDWVFWVDADEEVTPALKNELQTTFINNVQNSGFFVKGLYVWRGKELRYGMKNNKIALMHKQRMEFPVVNDLHIDGMGEMEGHYQPVFKQGFHTQRIGQLTAPLLHHAYDDEAAWKNRHNRYARWEAEMTQKKSWPVDPVPWRESAKSLIRTSIFRPWIMFLYSYILKFGLLDGVAGYEFARSRMRYCKMILRAL